MRLDAICDGQGSCFARWEFGMLFNCCVLEVGTNKNRSTTGNRARVPRCWDEGEKGGMGGEEELGKQREEKGNVDVLISTHLHAR